VAALEALEEMEQRLALRSLPEAKRRAWLAHWPSWAHEGQLPPDSSPGPDAKEWRVWVVLAGRGFGKTRAGAEWLSAFARAHPGASLALVGATVDEARAVMVEGRSGLLAVARPAELEEMVWEPSRRRLVFASGAEAHLYSAANPESLRGPEHHAAWCDELAKWRHGEATWNNLRLGLRAGEKPRVLVTTTPRSVPVLKRIVAQPGTERTGGGTRANPHLPEDFLEAAEAAHRGTRFGRQELEGVLIEDVEGAWWSRETIEKARVELGTVTGNCTHFRRIVVGVDPPASAEGTCGIVVCGEAAGLCYVLADCSASGLSPEGWARRVAQAAGAWDAHRVVAEKNNGGTMVEAVLRGADAGLPVSLVHAADGKAARAEPVAILFETGKAKFAGAFPELEDELAGFTPEGWQGRSRSPDRADAMIWAMTELGVKKKRAEPRVRFL
jgi:phage terminase large subunit-like protein